MLPDDTRGVMIGRTHWGGKGLEDSSTVHSGVYSIGWIVSRGSVRMNRTRLGVIRELSIRPGWGLGARPGVALGALFCQLLTVSHLLLTVLAAESPRDSARQCSCPGGHDFCLLASAPARGPHGEHGDTAHHGNAAPHHCNAHPDNAERHGNAEHHGNVEHPGNLAHPGNTARHGPAALRCPCKMREGQSPTALGGDGPKAHLPSSPARRLRTFATLWQDEPPLIRSFLRDPPTPPPKVPTTSSMS